MENVLQISSAAVTDRGLSDKRPENEDSYLEMPKSGIFAVADGVGGAQAGEVASQMAMEIIGEAFTNLPDESDPGEVMQTAIERANSAIYQMAHELPQLANMASTVVALHLNGSVATIAHVGDSRLYSVDREGELYRQTEDHSMVAEEVRAGRMTEAQAENHPSRNVISRALGAEPQVEVDIKTVAVEPGTAFLICSDGITRHVSDDEIRGVLTFGGTPVDICEYLKGLCYERGAEDNLTAVVVKAALNGAARVVYNQFAETVSFDEEIDESTVATARSPFESKADDVPILELDREPEEIKTAESVPLIETPVPIEAEIPAAVEPERPETLTSEKFTIFGGDSDEIESEPEKVSNSKFLIAAGSVLLGALIGLGVYHFALAPRPIEAPTPPLTEMKSENVALTSFEKLRRTVDSDPAAYIKEVPPAEDADDFYLLGRAYLLTGDIQNARFSLLEAQKRIAKTDEANAKVLANDISLAIVIANDVEAQKRFKTEIDNTAKGLSNSAPANTANANR